MTNLNCVDDLKKYYINMSERAEHHAQKVTEVLDYIILELLKVGEDFRTVKPSNSYNFWSALWFTTGNGEYVLRYDHKIQKIELLKGKLRSRNVVAHFDNSTGKQYVHTVFTTI